MNSTSLKKLGAVSTLQLTRSVTCHVRMALIIFCMTACGFTLLSRPASSLCASEPSRYSQARTAELAMSFDERRRLRELSETIKEATRAQAQAQDRRIAWSYRNAALALRVKANKALMTVPKNVSLVADKHAKESGLESQSSSTSEKWESLFNLLYLLSEVIQLLEVL